MFQSSRRPSAVAKWPYNTTRWKRLRAQQLREQPLCIHCKALGRLVPAHHVDHIQAINAGGEPFDMGNLQSLCASCHSVKTNSDMHGKPLKGCDVNGNPLDAGHWWSSKDRANNEKISQS
ncbi:HNH endonuclease [Oceanidesulfovibrio indonesiensis]|uniref:HNH endonuclease n=1 Tax=Oceanidesulfovibrio indonesiensis TaxID=54767 RepID=A0A7M3MDL8_9BACT|nr:HNH endonuclease [Oceanidesulfovibrio indonesiensis]